MNMPGTETDTALAYQRFSTFEAVGKSPVYATISAAISEDTEVLNLIRELPTAKRQPNLVLGAAKFLGAPLNEAGDPWAPFREWLLANWHAVADVARQRATQTNEVGRCATLLPFLDEINAPVAVLEVGCSAGLNLYPDAYSYRYTGAATTTLGTASPTLECRLDGVKAPRKRPNVVWRGGLDLNPLDPTNTDDVTWLKALIWPGQPEREQRLDEAVSAVQATGAPPIVHKGDLVDDLDELLAQVPDDLHLVIFHTAVLAYADDAKRQVFEAKMRELSSRRGGFTWISNESPRVMPGVAHQITQRSLDAPNGKFVIAVNGEARAWSAPHGGELTAV